MQTQYINEMLNLPELRIHQILSIDVDEVHIEAVPLGDKQCCPCCGSDQAVIRKGRNDRRRVRYLPVFGKKPICMCPPFGCIVRAAKPVLYGRTSLSGPNSATASFSVPMPSNRHSVRQPPTAPGCNKRRNPAYPSRSRSGRV